MTKLIEKNTTIPTRRSQVFSTAADSQPQVEIHVLQGEREMAGDNRTLGRFILDGIPPAPRGIPQIEVTFDIDANGILSVNAKDKASSRQQSIRIEGSGGLKKDEIERMVKDADAHASEDRARREVIEKRNALDSLIYQAEKTLSENGEKIAAADKQAVEAAVAEARKDLDSSDAAKLAEAHRRVEAALHKVAEALYKAQSAQEGGAAPPGGAGASRGAEGDVVDAEYHEEKGNG
jgi:molecular chaperone DnaK